MRKADMVGSKTLDWSEYTGSLPLRGTVYPKGHDNEKLAARMQKAGGRMKIGQTA